MVETAIPHLGETIGGKYRVERALGRGGMGAVFEVTHCVTHKHFAIKWLMSEPSSSNDAVTRFVREAQVAGRCEHRNIVEVYDIDRHNGQLFMVMELLKGESLAERLLRCSTGIAYYEACRLLLPCIEAVAEAHLSGIIHRDLKPANIFICQARGREPEYAKVLDFGVSRFVTPDGQFEISAQTRSGAIIGTPFYMAPEQMRGHPIDARADVYSMGVTLYETLTGRRPYDATSYGDLLLKVADSQPVSVSSLVPGMPRPLCDVVNCAMATDPAKRYASMEDLAHALEPFAGVAVPNTPPLSWSPATQFTPLVSETPSVHALAEAHGVPRAPSRKTLWIALAAIAALGLIAWRTLSHDADDARLASPKDSEAPVTSATSAAAATAAEHEVVPATPSSPGESAQGRDSAPAARSGTKRPSLPEGASLPDSETTEPDHANRSEHPATRTAAAARTSKTKAATMPDLAGSDRSASQHARDADRGDGRRGQTAQDAEDAQDAQDAEDAQDAQDGRDGEAAASKLERARQAHKKRQEQAEPHPAATQPSAPAAPRRNLRKARAPAHLERGEF